MTSLHRELDYRWLSTHYSQHTGKINYEINIQGDPKSKPLFDWASK